MRESGGAGLGGRSGTPAPSDPGLARGEPAPRDESLPLPHCHVLAPYWDDTIAHELPERSLCIGIRVPCPLLWAASP